MNIQRWISRREPNWKRLDTLLRQVQKRGLKSLQASEIQEMASLYRSVSADLARARTNKVGNFLIQDLQKLTSRGYNQIYQGSRRQDWKTAWEFCLWGFPAVVQQTFGYTAIATAIFLLGGLIAWWYSWQDPTFISLVVPEDLISLVRDKGELWMGGILGQEPVASSGITINNIGVCLRAVSGGVTGYLQEIKFLVPPGIFTCYLLFYNGMLIGAIGTLVGQNNLAYLFWSFVFPHGSLELPAIFLSGGAGLLIARAIFFPGQYRRIDALKFYGLQAAQLLFGVIVLLIIAGIIEGFFSPLGMEDGGVSSTAAILAPLKYVTGIVLFIFLVVYCRRQRAE